MSIHADRRIRVHAVLRACLIALLIDVLAFPPAMEAQQPTQSWNGGTGNWTGSSWTCSPTNGCAGPYPNNGDFSSATTYLATIGTGSDNVTLNKTSAVPSVTVDRLTLGTSSGTSTLNIANARTLTMGSSSSAASSNVMTIGSGGILNLQNGGSAILELSTSGTTASNSGQINLSDGFLQLQNSASGGNNSVITNNGSIAATGSGAVYIDDAAAGNTFTLSGSGNLTLADSTSITGYSGNHATLVNDTNHTIQVLDGGYGYVGSLRGLGNIGTINVGSESAGSPATLELNISSTSNSGTINVNSGSYLTLDNIGGTNSTYTNNGNINVYGTLQINNDDPSSPVDIESTNNGSLNLYGGTITSASGNNTESLVSGANHTIAGYGSINGLLGFTNNGTLNENGGMVISNVVGTQSDATPNSGINNTGTINVNESLTIDTSSGGSFFNQFPYFAETPGSVNVADGATLTFRNTAGGTAAIQNDGIINLGTSTGGSLVLDSSDGMGGTPAGTTFNLTSPTYYGVVTMVGNSSITGATGTENLINDTYHTIAAGLDANANPAAATATISNLNSFSNDGTVLVGGFPSVCGCGTGQLASQQGLVNATAVVQPTLTIDTTSGGSFSNDQSGAVFVADGNVLALQNTSGTPTAVFNNDGVILVGGSSGATLQFNSGGHGTTFDLTSANPGEFGGGVVFMTGASVLTGASGNESVINDTNHTIQGSGVIANLAGFTNNGALIEYNGLTVQNVGSFTNNGYTEANSGLTFDTTGGGTFNNSDTGNITAYDGAQLSFKHTSDPANPQTAVFTNNGAIAIGTTPTGGAVMVLDSSDSNGNGTFTTFSLQGNGSLTLMGSETGITGQTGTEGLINGAGHTIQNNGTGTISEIGSFTNDGTVDVAAGTLGISTADNKFTNGGTVTTGSDGAVLNITGDIFNTAAGVVNVNGNGDEVTATGDFNNSGQVTISAGGLVSAAGNYVQTGDSSVTDLGAGGQITATTFNLEAGLLTGGGTVNGNLDQTGGTLSPGDPQSIEILGDYTLEAGGTVQLDLLDWSSIDNGDYDQINATGNISLAGTLDLNLLAGFNAEIGDVFDVLTSQNGTINLNNGFTFNNQVFDSGAETFALNLVNVQGVGNELQLTVIGTGAGPVVPEPGTLSMFFAAMLFGCCVTWRVRRNRQGSIQ